MTPRVATQYAPARTMERLIFYVQTARWDKRWLIRQGYADLADRNKAVVYQRTITVMAAKLKGG